MATLPLTFDLYVNELIYDVQTKTYNTAESLKASGKLKYDGAAHVMASNDDESLYELKRAISTAIGDVHVALSEYINEFNSVTASAFNSASAYSVDDYVYYNGKLYQFGRAHTANNPWNPNEVTEVLAIDEDNILLTAVDTPAVIHLGFTFPSNFKPVYINSFTNGIHDFVVNRAAYMWYRQVIPEIAQACLADADSALEQVNKAMYSRQRPTRPTLP